MILLLIWFWTILSLFPFCFWWFSFHCFVSFLCWCTRFGVCWARRLDLLDLWSLPYPLLCFSDFVWFVLQGPWFLLQAALLFSLLFSSLCFTLWYENAATISHCLFLRCNSQGFLFLDAVLWLVHLRSFFHTGYLEATVLKLRACLLGIGFVHWILWVLSVRKHFAIFIIWAYLKYL